MKDLSTMSPVAKATYLERENTALHEDLTEAAQRLYRLKQEITGSLQILWVLAKREGGKISVPASDLIAAMGAVKRTHNAETDTYVFEAIDPTENQIAELQNIMAEQAKAAIPVAPSEQTS